MVVAARLTAEDFGVGRAAKLGGEDDERGVEQPAGLQVGEKGADRLVHGERMPGVILFEIVVLVPAILHDLDEPHAAFEEPACREAVASERFRLLVAAADAVGGERGRRFLLEIRRHGDRVLHGVGLRVVGDRRLDDRIVVRGTKKEPVELADGTQLVVLQLSGGLAGREVGQRLRTAAEELRRLERGRQEAVGAALPLPRAHHHEARQVGGVAAEAVVGPGPDAGKSLQERARVQESDGALMVGRRARDRVEKGDVVGAAADVRKEVAHHLAARAMRPELPRALQDVGRGTAGDVFLLARELERLAVLCDEPRLVVEAVDVRETAVHEEPDHPLRLRGCPRRDEAHIRGEAPVGQQAIECQPAKPERGLFEEAAALEHAAALKHTVAGVSGHIKTPSH